MDADTAKALAPVAGKAIDAATSLGNFVARVLGTIPEDTVGVLGGDWLHQVRIRNADQLHRRTDEILMARGAENNIEPVSLSIALPLFQAAQDESRSELQELWARLLANAMDPNRPPIRKVFIDTLQDLEILDTKILLKMFEEGLGASSVVYDGWEVVFNVRKDQFDLSVEHLKDLKLVTLKYVHNDVLRKMEHAMDFTLFGRELMRACQK